MEHEPRKHVTGENRRQHRYAWALEEPGHDAVDAAPQSGALPQLTAIARPVRVAVPARGDHEALVRVQGPRIQTIPVYWRSGWSAAVPELWLRAGAAAALGRAARRLPPRYGLVVLDAWRPLALQQQLYEDVQATSADPFNAGSGTVFVAEPSDDPSAAPPHLTGGTVDLSLSFDGRALQLGSGFDEFSARSATAFYETTPGAARTLRRVLYNVMHDEGFVVDAGEWWHYEYGTGGWSAITGSEPLYSAASAPNH